MTTVKLSISLEQQLVDFLEGCQRQHGIRSRSEVIGQGLKLLRERELERQYEGAINVWESEAALWDSVAGDGMGSGEGS